MFSSVNFIRATAFLALRATSNFFVGATPFLHASTMASIRGQTVARLSAFAVALQFVDSLARSKTASRSRTPCAASPMSNASSRAAIWQLGSATLRGFADALILIKSQARLQLHSNNNLNCKMLSVRKVCDYTDAWIPQNYMVQTRQTTNIDWPLELDHHFPYGIHFRNHF